jgi:phosphohistidine phosphatase
MTQPRYLLLMRHAKSSWADASMPDHQRPLNDRGIRAVPLVADWLLQQGIKIDLVLCSAAQRTVETARRLKQAGLDYDEYVESEKLYLASASEILAELQARAAKKAHAVLVIGHNPGLEVLASILAGQAINMPTAAIAVFEVRPSPPWQIKIDSGENRLVCLVKPKDLSPHADLD